MQGQRIRRLLHQLAEEVVPTGLDGWPAVRGRLHRSSRTGGRGQRGIGSRFLAGANLLAASAFVILVALAAGLVFQGLGNARGHGDTDVPSVLATPVAGAGAITPAFQPTQPSVGRRSLPIPRPEPPFQVLEPVYLPPGVRLVYYLYEPGPSTNATPVPAMPPTPDLEVAPVVFDAAARRARQLRGEGREPLLILIYAAGPDQVVELVQRSAPDAGIPGIHSVGTPDGAVVSVRAARAVAGQRDEREVVSWIDVASPGSASSLVEVYTTLGRAEALKVADGLQVVPRAHLPTPATAPPWPPSPVPLAQRPKMVVAAKADRATVEHVCGPWVPLPAAGGSTPEYERVICTARAYAGFTSPGGGYGVGVSRGGWREAATRLGVDPAAGPVGDPLVWSVSLAVTAQGGDIVILDAETGEPHLLVALPPLP